MVPGVQAQDSLKCSHCRHRADEHHVVYCCRPGEEPVMLVRCGRWIGGGRRCGCAQVIRRGPEAES